MKIKYKFLAFLIPVFSLALVAMSALTISVFEKDKLAYVFASTLETTETASAIIKAELDSQRPLFELLTSAFNFAEGKFPVNAKGILQMNETLALVEVDAEVDGNLKLMDYLGKWPEGLRDKLSVVPDSEDPQPLFFSGEKKYWGMAKSYSIKGYEPSKYRILLIFKRNPVTELLAKARYFDLFLAKVDGTLVAQGSDLTDPNSAQIVEKNAAEIIKGGTTSRTSEIHFESPKGQKDYLVAWVPTPKTRFGLISVTSKEKATQAITEMKKSSVGFLLVLLSIGLLAVLLMVRGLTKHIEALTGSLSKFSKGDLKVKSSVSTNDEIGIMSKVFNEMTDKITTLMSESVSKARMETELGTARSVQKKFIPAKDFRDDRVEINGYFEPASECGGDWWSYSIDGNSCWMMIGDVTGHGVASALMTAALKAGVSALTHIPDLKLSDFVEQLNKVICEAGQNQLMVTFFIARLDLDTGQLSYVNASHNPPIWMKTENSEMDFLMEIGGARLGQGHDSKYASTTVKLGERDLIFGFTDGLTEFENAEGREYGEKKVIKKIQKDFEAKTKLKEHRSSVLRDFKNFQKKTPLNDDLTYFFLQYKPGPANPWDLPPTQGPAA